VDFIDHPPIENLTIAFDPVNSAGVPWKMLPTCRNIIIFLTGISICVSFVSFDDRRKVFTSHPGERFQESSLALSFPTSMISYQELTISIAAIQT
jgi:hypothetical protein